MAKAPSRKSGTQPAPVQEVSETLLGRDLVTLGLIQRGRPLTRAEYLSAIAMREQDMTPELEADLPEWFQLTEEGEAPPPVIPRSMTEAEAAERMRKLAQKPPKRRANDLLRKTFGHTTPMQADEKLMQQRRPLTPREYAEHLAGEQFKEESAEEPSEPLAVSDRTSPTLQEQLSEIDWDKLDEMDAQEDAPPMMDAEWAPPRSAPQTWVPTREEMLAAGIPENLHGSVTWFNSLEEAKEALVPPSP